MHSSAKPRVWRVPFNRLRPSSHMNHCPQYTEGLGPGHKHSGPGDQKFLLAASLHPPTSPQNRAYSPSGVVSLSQSQASTMRVKERCRCRGEHVRCLRLPAAIQDGGRVHDPGLCGSRLLRPSRELCPIHVPNAGPCPLQTPHIPTRKWKIIPWLHLSGSFGILLLGSPRPNSAPPCACS